MGNCLRKKPRALQQPHLCNNCQREFPAGTALQEVEQHTANCHPPPPGQQPHPIQAQVEAHHIQINIQPEARPRQNNNIAQFLMDDFRNNKQKFYWAKELYPGSRTKYKWAKKPIPPLPVKSVAEMLALPQTQIKSSEFPTKQTWFRLQLEKLRISWQQGADILPVSRESFLMTTLSIFKEIEWHKEIKVQIRDDKVLDAGGLLREWATLIIKEIMHPDSGMFLLANCDDTSYKINSNADPDDHIIDCFQLLGNIVGKCVFERIPLQIFFDRSILKHILGQAIELDDIYFYDKHLYSSWDYLLNNKFDPEILQQTFSLCRKLDDYVELKPGGSKILVSMDNCQEYVALCIDYYTTLSVKPFLDAFLKGLNKVIPKKLLSIFEPLELEMILYGIPFIDLQDWKENTEYKGHYYRTHQIVTWFWEVLEELDQPTLAKFLQFCTGSQRTPVEGFRKLESNRGNCSKFCIESVQFNMQNPYPKAHTCFNRLELPLYETKEDLKLYVMAVVQADLEGQFGME